MNDSDSKLTGNRARQAKPPLIDQGPLEGKVTRKYDRRSSIIQLLGHPGWQDRREDGFNGPEQLRYLSAVSGQCLAQLVKRIIELPRKNVQLERYSWNGTVGTVQFLLIQ